MSKDREIIRWRSGLTVEVEKPRILPGVGAGSRNADGHIAFECDSVSFGIIVDVCHLSVQMILNKAVECDLGGCFRAYSRDDIIGESGVFTPGVVIGSTETVAHGAESSVGEQPMSVPGCEVFVVLRFGCFGPVLSENLAQIFNFPFIDALIVYFPEGI